MVMRLTDATGAVVPGATVPGAVLGAGVPGAVLGAAVLGAAVLGAAPALVLLARPQRSVEGEQTLAVGMPVAIAVEIQRAVGRANAPQDLFGGSRHERR